MCVSDDVNRLCNCGVCINEGYVILFDGSDEMVFIGERGVSRGLFRT